VTNAPKTTHRRPYLAREAIRVEALLGSFDKVFSQRLAAPRALEAIALAKQEKKD
jgi:hypothetical protein